MEILKNLNLLLVEDDREIRENFSRTLQNYFNRVYEAENGSQALALYREKKVHLIFTDYVMPIMDGPEFIREIRKFDRHIPIAVISNHMKEDMLLRCIPLNLMGYIAKPLTYAGLKEFLETAVTRSIDEGMARHYFRDGCFYDYATGTLHVDGDDHILTRLESALIQLLISQNGRPVTLQQIEEHLYHGEPAEGSGIKNLVYRIKKKYGFGHIRNVKEVGYLLAGDSQ